MAWYRAYQNDPLKRKARAAWSNMKYRCYNPKALHYDRYGGRGIKVCDEWRSSFLPFYEWSLAHGMDFGLTIERVDNDGDYCPANCRWEKQKVQANNTSRNRYVEFGGKRLTVQQWADALGITSQALTWRLESGAWTVEEALTAPKGSRPPQFPTLRKRIVQISLDGNSVQEWESVSAAAKGLSCPTSNISRALTHGGTARGYRWEYADKST